MTLKELWKVTPQNHIFYGDNGKMVEYVGEQRIKTYLLAERLKIKSLRVVNYPNYPNSIYVEF